MADITATGQVITDWTAVAQNTIVHSDILDISDDLEAILSLQAFLDSSTAHTGTKIIVEISCLLTGDEDWVELTNLVILIGTANPEAIDDDPSLAVGSTTILISSTTGYVTNGAWIAIEDGTLANSELVRQKGYTTDTNITLLDGTTNLHLKDVNLFNQAISKIIASLSASVRRVRLVIDNTYDNNGSTLNYRLLISRAMDID